MKKKLPFVSVVVPAYNESVMLPACLESLKEQDFQGKYEVVVVDNNSIDLTPQIARIYGARVIPEKRQGVAFARQKGFENAKGEVILSTDADTIAPPNWISGIIKEFEKDDKIVAVGGTCRLIGINTPLKMVSATLAPLLYLLDKIFDYPGTLQGWNSGVKKSAFTKAGGFDTTLRPGDVGEDRDLGKRLRKLGKVKIFYKIKVKTSARRFVGLGQTLKYVFLNYIYFSLKKKSLPGTFQTIRQKPYESYDVVNDAPFFLTILFVCLIAILMLSGAVPFINIWSTSSVKTQDKIIALTFDSLNSSATPQILNILKSKNINATFFVTGKDAEQNPNLVKEIYAEGDVIGNSSSSPNIANMLKTPSLILKDANGTGNIIDQIIGKKPKFFRPPEGYRTIWGDFSLDKNGYEIVTWNSSTSDLARNPTSRTIAIDIIKSAKPGGIIDMPADYPNQTVRATEEIVDLLTADGYKFVTIDQLLGKPGYFSR